MTQLNITSLPQKDSRPTTNKLFPNNMAKLIICQGKLGDCYLLASILALSKIPQGAQDLRQSIQSIPTTPSQPDDYVVRFKLHPETSFTVSANELSHWMGQARQGKEKRNRFYGVSIIEIAYAKYLQANRLSDNNSSPYTALAFGGRSKDALQVLAGQKAVERNIVSPTQPVQSIFQHVFIPNAFKVTADNIQTILNCPNTACVAISNDNDISADGLQSHHAYALQSSKHSDATITLLDTNQPKHPVKVSQSRFLKDFCAVDTVGFSSDKTQ